MHGRGVLGCATMKLLRDEPQQLLVLESPALGIPRAVGYVVKLLVFGFAVAPVLFFAVPMLGSGRPELPLLAFGAMFALFWMVGASRVFVGLRKTLRFPRRIRVDRYAGELEIEEEGLLEGAKAEVFRLDRVQRVRVATTLAKPSLGEARSAVRGGPRPGVKLTLELVDARERAVRRELSFLVEHLDKREEVADFAYRFGRAAGLHYSRVLRSDPREMEIELQSEAGHGMETVPLIEGPADYARDRIVPQAGRAAAQEKIAVFAAADFRGPAQIAVWEPRREVRFVKPLGFAAIGCLPFVALIVLGPTAFVFLRTEPSDIGGRIVMSVFLGIFGLIFGLVAVAAVGAALPRRVRLDWSAHTLEVGGLVRRSTRPLSDIAELELKCVRTYHRGGKNSSAYNSYRCDVIGHMRGGAEGQAATEVLVTTEEFREDADSPYRMTLPLAVELAEALGVKRRVTDYS